MLGRVKFVWDKIQRGLAWVGEKIAIVVTPVFLTFFYFTVIAMAESLRLPDLSET